jgi:hypothetical protein
MTITIPNPVRSAGADAMVDRVDAGAAAGTITLYDGTRPGPNDAVTTQQALATFTLNDPAFGGAVDGVKTLDVTGGIDTVGLDDSTATWGRAEDSDGNTVFDGSVGTSSADFIVNTTTISTGVDVSLLSGTMTQPSGE